VYLGAGVREELMVNYHYLNDLTQTKDKLLFASQSSVGEEGLGST
jgi:hypothetical protein